LKGVEVDTLITSSLLRIADMLSIIEKRLDEHNRLQEQENELYALTMYHVHMIETAVHKNMIRKFEEGKGHV